MKFEHILTAFEAEPWAIQREKLAVLADVLAARVAGEKLVSPEFAAVVSDARAKEIAETDGKVAIIPVYGVLAERMDKLAGPLKDMMRAIGLSESQIEGADKENSTRLLQGKTPRYAMQTLGTEWGRNIIGAGFWIGMWESRVLDVLGNGGRVVVDDCRFANEAHAVRSLGGIVVRIQGRGGIASSHESEKVAFEPYAILMNNGSVASFHDRLDSLLSLKCHCQCRPSGRFLCNVGGAYCRFWLVAVSVYSCLQQLCAMCHGFPATTKKPL